MPKKDGSGANGKRAGRGQGKCSTNKPGSKDRYQGRARSGTGAGAGKKGRGSGQDQENK